ncbi:MAG: myo-inositol-1(or 4)-monophosphatase [Kiritimatiellia bacterium]
MTNADIEAQEIIHLALSKAFPGVAIVGEEGQLPDKPPATCWYIDPIDGTGSFIEGLPTWGPTIGLVVDYKPVLGAFLLPRTGDFWCVKKGAGAWWDDRRLDFDSVPDDFNDHVLFAPSRFHTRAPRGWPGKIRSLGSIAAHLALVAGGAGTVAAIARWNPWDVACGILLIEEAGGVITDWHANPMAPLNRSDAVTWGSVTPFLAGAERAVERLVQDAQEARVHAKRYR